MSIAGLSAPRQADAQSAFTAKVDFTEAGGAVATGYLRDMGESFAARSGAGQGSGLSYGWVTPGTSTPLDLVGNGRDRNRTGIDQRLDSVIHMQADDISGTFSGVKAEGAWEIAVPNGTYAVTVAAGDKVYDSSHTLNLEEQNVFRVFRSATGAEYRTATTLVHVSDGRLTVSAVGGTNTKLAYVDVVPASSADRERPAVHNSIPLNFAGGVRRDAGISTESLYLPNGGIDPDTLDAAVRLLRVRDSAPVTANVNTDGAGGVVSLQPTALLEATTLYRFEITSALRDSAGGSFLPFTSYFTTGTAGGEVGGDGAAFEAVDLPGATGAMFSSVAIGPDSRLYAATLVGDLHRFDITPDGTLANLLVISTVQTANAGPRMIIGLAFDPAATASNPVLWVTHSTFGFQNVPDWGGKLSRLSGATLGTYQDYVVNLPRSSKDHLTNSIVFRNGLLYLAQGSNTAMGSPDAAWDNRDADGNRIARVERLLSAAVLEIDVRAITAPPLNVKTAEGGTYNPYASGAPVRLYASGVRNAYDLVWHTNGALYLPTNGSAGGGATPASDLSQPSCDRRIDGQAYTGDVVPGIDPLEVTQRDFLFRVDRLGYYGHPNPSRCEWVLNGGNPTVDRDPAQVSAYPVGTMPDQNWRGFAYDLELNKSPNGAIEYRSGHWNGALQNRLLFTRFSQGDDIMAVQLGNGGAVIGTETGIPGLTGLVDPLDLVEDRRNGNLYITEDVKSEVGNGRIRLFRPTSATPTTPVARINFQPSGTTPAGYAADSGLPFEGSRGFGWVQPGTTTALDMSAFPRLRSGTADLRLRTIIHMQGTPAAPRTGAWEYAVPNGNYRVTVTVGDTGAYDSEHRVVAEGAVAVDKFVPSASNAFASGSVSVTVTDGRLTVAPTGGTNTKLAYLHIDRLETADSAPRVTGTQPAPGATGVALSANVEATFSEALDPASLTTNSFTVRRQGASINISGTVTYDATTRTARFDPLNGYKAGQTYTATLTTAVRNTNGTPMTAAHSWTFTAVADSAPTVTAVRPAQGATGVALSANVEATFSEAMQASTLTTSAFKIRRQGATVNISGAVTYDDATRTARFDPVYGFKAGQLYTATVTTAVRDLAGVPLVQNVSWTFTADTPPTVTAVRPARGATGVALSANVEATFSEAMQASTLTTSSFKIRRQGATVDISGAVTYDDATRTARFDPVYGFKAGQLYTATVTTAVRDLAGVPLLQDVSWTFTATD